MTESNLAIVFSPTLKLSNDAVANFVSKYDTIFDDADLPPLPPTWPDVEFGKLYVPEPSSQAPKPQPAATTTQNDAGTTQLIDLGGDDQEGQGTPAPTTPPPPPPPLPAGGRHHHHHKPPTAKPLPQIPQKQLPPPPPRV